MTLIEAKKLQKERDKRSIVWFIVSVALTALITFLLFKFTTLFSISSAFYLVPIGLLALTVRKTKVYLFFTAREFRGKVVRLDVYPVKTGNIKGKHVYETMQGEALEVAMYIDNGKTAKLKEMYASPLTYKISVGTELSLLRFIDQPIIIETKND